MSFKLRDYQETDIKRLRSAFLEKDSIIYNLPTGGGKTASTSYMLKSLAQQGKRGWFICHRKELLEQASSAFSKQGIQHGLIGGNNKFNPHEKIQVCSVLSLLNKIDELPQPDFIIWDECHHIAAISWDKIFKKTAGAKHLGLSATPIRLDGKGLDNYFQEIIRGLSMKELISQGYLCPYKIYAPSIPDLTRLGKIKGEFNESQLNSIIKQSFIFGDIIKHWKIHAINKRTAIFCSSVEHSKEIASEFSKLGIIASHLDSSTPAAQRSKIISDFENGKIQVLTNVDLISEGFDLPAIECVILLRPTMSLGLYLQQVGRALRPSPNKREAIILDHTGNSLRHGLPDANRYWSLEGKVIIDNQNESKGRVCEKCNAVFSYTKKICECGEIIKIKTKEITYLDGSLIEVENDALTKKGAITEKNAIEIIDLYFNHGWNAIDIQEKLFNSKGAGKRIRKNWGCIISDIVHNKTWRFLARPNVTESELSLLNSKYRFHKTYEIDSDSGCWNHNSYISSNGAANIKYKKKSISLHKFSWLIHYGEPKVGECIVRKCKNKACINPLHLESITYAEKTRRSAHKPSREEMIRRAKKGAETIRKNPEMTARRDAALRKLHEKRKLIAVWIDNKKERIRFNSYTAAAKYLKTSVPNVYSAVHRKTKCMGYTVQKDQIF